MVIPILGTVSKSWMAETLGVVFDRQYYFDPRHRHAIDLRCNAYLRENLADLNLLFSESNLGRLSFYHPRQVLVGGIQPNMILGMLVGAEFLPQAQMDADISPRPLAGCSAEDLPRCEALLAHAVVQQFEDQFRSIQNDSLGQLEPVPPFFWDASGRAAIHGPLTTAQKLVGESIFAELMTAPEHARSILNWVTEATIGLVRHFAGLAQREITEVHVGECSACMIGAELFSQFVRPAITAIGRALGPVRLHSCGTSDHLLGCFREIEGLHSLDTGGGTSVAGVREVLGDDVRLEIAPLVDDLLGPTHQPLLAWADRVMDQNAGGPLAIVYHLERGYDIRRLGTLQDHIGRQMQ